MTPKSFQYVIQGAWSCRASRRQLVPRTLPQNTQRLPQGRSGQFSLLETQEGSFRDGPPVCIDGYLPFKLWIMGCVWTLFWNTHFLTTWHKTNKLWLSWRRNLWWTGGRRVDLSMDKPNSVNSRAKVFNRLVKWDFHGYCVLKHIETIGISRHKMA